MTDLQKIEAAFSEYSHLSQSTKDVDAIIKAAQKVYDLSLPYYGKNNPNTAASIVNLATIYAYKSKDDTHPDLRLKAWELYEQYLEIIDKIKAKKDKDYIYFYLNYLESLSLESNQQRATLHAKNIHNASQKLDYSDAEHGDIQFSIAMALYNNRDFNDAHNYFKRANKHYLNAHGPDHFKVGKSYFWMAKREMTKRRQKSAERNLLAALDVFDKNPEQGASLKQNTHAFLVALYESMGKSDAATLHCQAIAIERPKDFDQFITPLYRINPKFPPIGPRQASRLQKEPIEVLLQFDVDKNGRTSNIKVIDSDNVKFNRPSIQAARSYRYAPSVKDGELIETIGAKLNFVYGVSQ
ncbi:energy transducer TonB [Pseudemcibacter aquimaris]|uniref:energy transducer TonB n=1 Tax=Pseudemcibacter aquimaris TaxID=2857064 RepID=UPI002011A8ED|nr:energy transducer TonB [Pseudemcibacter aquimaris]MCC3860088.1 energy transducer TonB [Pseudemcibacter aquimaris]WDU57417.1 energy transducer TonB [Pseudemcibacter aquimaris]